MKTVAELTVTIICSALCMAMILAAAVYVAAMIGG